MEELIQIGMRLNAEKAAAPSNGGPVFGADSVKKTAESFKLVSKACSEKCSSKQNRSLLNVVINRGFDQASTIVTLSSVHSFTLLIRLSTTTFRLLLLKKLRRTVI